MPTDTLPQTPEEFFALCPLWELCAVLKPLTGIMQHIMNHEGCDYETACHALVAEHLVEHYARYLEGFDVLRCPDFATYVKIAFVYRVRSKSAYSQKREKLRAERGFTIDARPVETIERLEAHASLTRGDCQMERLIGREAERDAHSESSAVFSELREMESLESWLVWNHGALGHSYDACAAAQGISATTAKKIYLGAMARLRRVVGVG